MIGQAGQSVQAKSAYNGCPDNVLGMAGIAVGDPTGAFSVSRVPVRWW